MYIRYLGTYLGVLRYIHSPGCPELSGELLVACTIWSTDPWIDTYLGRHYTPYFRYVSRYLGRLVYIAKLVGTRYLGRYLGR